MGAQGSQEVGTPVQNEQKLTKNRWKFDRNSEQKCGHSALFFERFGTVFWGGPQAEYKKCDSGPLQEHCYLHFFTTITGRGPHRAGPEFHRTPLRLTHASGFKNPAQK